MINRTWSNSWGFQQICKKSWSTCSASLSSKCHRFRRRNQENQMKESKEIPKYIRNMLRERLTQLQTSKDNLINWYSQSWSWTKTRMSLPRGIRRVVSLSDTALTSTSANRSATASTNLLSMSITRKSSTMHSQCKKLAPWWTTETRSSTRSRKKRIHSSSTRSSTRIGERHQQHLSCRPWVQEKPSNKII